MSEFEIRTGDNMDPMHGLPSLPDKSVDVVITDPPYSEHTHAKQWIGAALTRDGKPRVSTAHKGLGFGAITDDVAFANAAEFARVCRRWVVVFTDLEGVSLWRAALETAGLDYVRTCIWDKVDGAPQFTGDRPAAGAEAMVCAHPRGKKRWNGGGRRNVFRYAVNGERGAKPHPSTKPVALMSDLVSLFSEPGEVVCDPYAGSGSTGVACRMNGRDFLGWEFSEEWAELARRRIEGKRAIVDDLQPELFG